MIESFLKHKYNLNFLNCANTIYNLFVGESDILDFQSHDLKSRLKDYVQGNNNPTKNIQINSYTYFSKLFDYFDYSFNEHDFENLKSIIPDEDLENLKIKINESGFFPSNNSVEQAIKLATTQIFIELICVSIATKNIRQKYDEKSRFFFDEFDKKMNGIREISLASNSKLYFAFLILMLSDYGILYIEEILNHHLNKTRNKKDFVSSLAKYIKLTPEPLQDDLILSDVNKWIEKHSHLENIVIDFSDLVIDFNPEISNKDAVENKKEEKEEVQTGLQTLFTVKDWEKYVDALTICEPPMLKKKNDTYYFIGNKKNQKGVVASWFKYLKSKGVINQSINRDEIAKVLSSEINNFSIVGSTIDNISETYNSQFAKQLEKLYTLAN